MSAFSRGCFLRHQFLHLTRIHFSLPSKSLQQPRLFSSASILRAVTKAAPTAPLKQALPKNKPSFAPTKARTSTPPVYQTYASRLAEKNSPTLLYLSPSHTAFIISSYLGAGFCFTYAVTAFWSNYLNAPPDLNAWVPIAFGGISFLMAVAGGYFLLGPAWIVKSITAMPPAALKAAGAVRANVAKSSAPELKIEIELRKMLPLPFFPARKLYVRPEEIELRHALTATDKRASAAELRAIRLQEEADRQKELEYERTHIMSRGVRHMSRAFFDLFVSIRRTWTREGFAKIYIKGYTYKLDVSGGWALDGGRALDRLVTIKPKL